MSEPAGGTVARVVAAGVGIAVLALAAGLAADRVIREVALRHYRATAPLGLAAAMGGLFAAGIVALLLILVAVRVSSRRQRAAESADCGHGKD